ncbi:sugar phosphate nucleotidyltransferase [Peijinzhouia sedimentorum]
MKALIPLAGIGSRLRPHTHTQPKSLVPVAGKPVLAHIMDRLIGGGIKEFVLVVGYLSEKIIAFVEQHYSDDDIEVRFVNQSPREGIGHAVWMAKNEIINDEELLIILGDSILNMDYENFIHKKGNIIGVKKVAEPGLFGVAELQKNGAISKLIEKPSIPKSNQALVGIYKIADLPLLLNGIEQAIKNNLRTLGEYHLTDALMYMVENHASLISYDVENWYDCGKMASLLKANAILLNKPEFKDKNKLKFPKTIIIPPVSIGANCIIRNSVIGPNVAIGDNSIVNYSIVRNSIIGSFSELNSTVLEKSIIGNDSLIKGHANSLNIGDNTEINFNA